MGFSLFGFFNDLKLILENEEMGRIKKLEMIEQIVNENYELAKQCGELNEL